MGWDHYHKSFRDFDWKLKDGDGKKQGNDKRKIINLWRRTTMVVQYVGFAIGVATIAYFAGVNVDNARKPETPQQQSKATSEPSTSTATPTRKGEN